MRTAKIYDKRYVFLAQCPYCKKYHYDVDEKELYHESTYVCAECKKVFKVDLDEKRTRNTN